MTEKKQESLFERVRRARQKRQPTKPGHEITADEKEERTPTSGEFFSNLEKVSKPEK